MKKFLTLILTIVIILNISAQDKGEQIVKYAKENMGKTIDRGECWDLVAFALDNAKAEWQMPFDFGDEIDYKKDKIKKGDIISFDGAKFLSDNYAINFPMHYAIVYDVKDNDNITIAHQNHNNLREVQLLDLTLSDLKKGKMQFYRAR